jgi:hypothetical protein
MANRRGIFIAVCVIGILLPLVAEGTISRRVWYSFHKPSAAVEGESWSLTDLANYLQARGLNFETVSGTPTAQEPSLLLVFDAVSPGDPGKKPKQDLVVVYLHPNAESAKEMGSKVRELTTSWGRFALVGLPERLKTIVAELN